MQIDTKGIVERAAARAKIHAERLTTARPPAALERAEPGPVTSREALIRRMADDMRDIAGVSGSVDEAALANRGWSAGALASYSAEAREVANGQSVRRS